MYKQDPYTTLKNKQESIKSTKKDLSKMRYLESVEGKCEFVGLGCQEIEVRGGER